MKKKISEKHLSFSRLANLTCIKIIFGEQANEEENEARTVISVLERPLFVAT